MMEDPCWEKNTATVGTISTGDFYSIDALFTPAQAGEQEIHVVIEYTDAFNQSKTIENTLKINVEEAPEPYPGENEGGINSADMQPVSLWGRIVQFFKGLIGLDSSSELNQDNITATMDAQS